MHETMDANIFSRLGSVILLAVALVLFPVPVLYGNPGLLGGRVVVVDPGHGGYDPGAVRGGVYEKDINLRVALKIKKSLEDKGAAVVLTRKGDYNLAVPGLHKREAHRYDLNKRIGLADGADASVFVSIHVNCIYNRDYGGAEVFYSPRSEGGKKLAECIQEELRTIPGMRKRAAKTNRCYVLANARVPAVLVEMGYLSNQGERKNLLDDEYQTLLAEKICAGIYKYFAGVSEGIPGSALSGAIPPVFNGVLLRPA